jgi:FdhE protein
MTSRKANAGVGGLLRKLIGGQPPLPPAVAQAQAELTQLAQGHPALQAPCAVVHDLLPLLFAEPVSEPPFALTAEQITAKMDAGLPLLRGEALPLDAARLRQRWQAVCGVLERHQPTPELRRPVEGVRAAAGEATALAGAVFAGRPEAVAEYAARAGVEPALTGTVLRLALLPVLARWSADLAPLWAGRRWEHGHCPACGSWPLLGEFRGLEQLCHLRCGWCASEWEHSRLRCPYCGTDDHRRLGYLHVEGEEARSRVAVCDACRGFVKMVATLTPPAAPQLLVLDVATLPLALAAAERGYVPLG